MLELRRVEPASAAASARALLAEERMLRKF
jgi:hypothetical protein